MMKTKVIKVLWQIVLIVVSSNSIAEQTKEQGLNYSKVKANAIKEEKLSREQWGLSTVEWTRYKTLMKGIRGSISPANISPLEVLGTHARTDQERRKYAELWAEMRHEDITRILAFQKAYNVAFAKLFPDEQIINTALLNLKNKPKFSPGDRVLVFLKIDQCSECDHIVRRMMADKDMSNLHIDIYFIDTNSKDDNARIRLWAQKQKIDKQRLKARTITLNHDNGNLFKITKQVVNPVPLIFSANAKTIKGIDY